jgi:predicted CopG family antitoxin
MRTTIQISMETREKLKSLGKKGESYDQIILRLYEREVQQQ